MTKLTERQSRNRVKAQPPAPLTVIDSWTKPSSSHQRTAVLPRSKPKANTTTTTTTTRMVQHREPSRYDDSGFHATLPMRPPHSRKHSSSKHPTIVERESLFAPSSSKSASRAPPRSNKRFYEHPRVEPVDSRGRAVGGYFDAGPRTTYIAPRAHSQDRGRASGAYSAFGSSRGASRERGSGDGYGYTFGRDDLSYGSRRISHVGSLYGEGQGQSRVQYGYVRR